MLQIANAFFKLPGHYLSPGEDESLGLKRRLDIQLTQDCSEQSLPPGTCGGQVAPNLEALGGGDWEVGDCLGTWWRPNYETYMVSEFDVELLHDECTPTDHLSSIPTLRPM